MRIVIMQLILAALPLAPFISAEELVTPKTADQWIRVFNQPMQTKGIQKGFSVERDRQRAGAFIHFDTDSAKIKPDAFPLLEELGKALTTGLTDLVFIIVGHADERGTDQYNRDLSQRRADAVRRHLISHFPTTAQQLASMGLGESDPLCRGHQKTDWAWNRRVELRKARRKQGTIVALPDNTSYQVNCIQWPQQDWQ